MNFVAHADDVERSLTDDAKRVMIHPILSWAQFDTALTHSLLVAPGMSYDNGPILFGRMDTRTKIDKLKTLYQHHKMDDAAKSIRNLSAFHKVYVGARNAAPD